MNTSISTGTAAPDLAQRERRTIEVIRGIEKKIQRLQRAKLERERALISIRAETAREERNGPDHARTD